MKAEGEGLRHVEARALHNAQFRYFDYVMVAFVVVLVLSNVSDPSVRIFVDATKLLCLVTLTESLALEQASAADQEIRDRHQAPAICCGVALARSIRMARAPGMVPPWNDGSILSRQVLGTLLEVKASDIQNIEPET